MIVDIPGDRPDTLRIELRDDLDSRISGAELHVTVEGAPTVTARTDAWGVATVPLGGELRGRPARVEFPGTEFLDGTVRHLTALDARANVELVPTLPRPGALSLDGGPQIIRVHARSKIGGAGVTVRARDERGRALAAAETDALGRATLVLSPHDLGEPGSGRLFFESAETESHRASSAVVPVVRTLTTQLTLDAPPRELRPGRPLVIEGSLATARGPLADRSVSLWLNDAPAARTVTDVRGRFRFALTPDSSSAPALEGFVRFDGHAEGSEPAESAPFTVALRPPPPRWPFVLIPLGFMAFLALARRRRLETASAPKPARRPLRALFERPARSLRVRVEASRSREPIEGARLWRDGELLASSDARGEIFVEELAPGEHRLEIEAEGFVRSTLELGIPARPPALRVVTLLETREAATRAMEDVARRRGVAAESIAASTHREMGERAARARGELDELVSGVDRAYYGPDEPTEETVRELEERSRDVDR